MGRLYLKFAIFRKETDKIREDIFSIGPMKLCGGYCCFTFGQKKEQRKKGKNC